MFKSHNKKIKPTTINIVKNIILLVLITIILFYAKSIGI